MGDGAPISQEIRLPTNVGEVMVATAKLDELIARVDKLEHATNHTHQATKKHHEESERGFHGLWETMGKVVKREAELAVGIHAIGAAGLEAHGHLTEFFEFIGAEAALELLKKIGEEVYDVGKEAIKAAANAERMNFALDAASGGKEAGENVRRFVEANAKISEFTEAENESAFLKLRRFGVGKEKSSLYMQAAEDLAAVSAPGERQGVYQESLYAFARLHAKGRLDARSAMRLGIGVEDLKTQPGFKGLSNQKVWEKAEKTNLDENTIMALVMKHTGEEAIGQRGREASELLLTKMTKLTELPELFFKRLGETGTTKKLASEIDSILEKLDPDSPTGKRIFGALESAFESITESIGEIDFEEIGSAITHDVVPAIREMIDLMGPALKLVEHTISFLHTAFEGGRVAVKAISDPLGAGGDLVAGKGIRKSAYEQLGERGALPSQHDQPSLLSDLTGKTLFNKYLGGNYIRDTIMNPDWWSTTAKATGEGAAKGVEEATGSYTSAIENMSTAGEQAFTSTNEIKSPSHLYRRHGRMISEGAALGIEDGADRIDDAMDSTFSTPGGGYNPMTSIAGRALGGGAQVTVGDITINVQGGATNGETAGAVRDELLRSLRPALLDLLEQQDAEG